jgi:hypothetical protein
VTTWTSRIRLRIDDEWSIPQQGFASLKKGELGILSSGPLTVIRVGCRDDQPWNEAAIIYEGAIANGQTLHAEIPSGAGLADGTLLRWDPTDQRFIADATPIEFSSSASGPLTYTDATDTWSVGTGFIPEAVDGGSFNDDYVAPSFTTSPAFEEPVA